MKQKTLREDAHSREAETCRKKQKHVASDRNAHSREARRENVPRHILFHIERK